MADRTDLATVRAFVEGEARLIDDREFDKWLDLYTQDCVYWVPVDRRQAQPHEGVAHFCDDKQIMMARAHRLRHPRKFGPEPAPQTAHVVSGVRIDSDDGDIIKVSSAQIILEYRDRDRFEEDTRIFGGRVIHHLRHEDGRFLIHLKRVDLLGSEASFNALAAPF